MKFPAILITCEHAGKNIPALFAPFFAGRTRLLASHRGYDRGARDIAAELSAAAAAPLILCEISRLLADVNRRLTNQAVFSLLSASMPPELRQTAITHYYQPYRAKVESAVSELLHRRGRLIHVSVHTFTPVFRGTRRMADAGILYDPARSKEKLLAARWKAAIHGADGDLVVRCNYPYRGTSDGIVSFMRSIHGPDRYVGLELEVNQRLTRRSPNTWRRLRRLISDSFCSAVRAGDR